MKRREHRIEDDQSESQEIARKIFVSCALTSSPLEHFFFFISCSTNKRELSIVIVVCA